MNEWKPLSVSQQASYLMCTTLYTCNLDVFSCTMYSISHAMYQSKHPPTPLNSGDRQVVAGAIYSQI